MIYDESGRNTHKTNMQERQIYKIQNYENQTLDYRCGYGFHRPLRFGNRSGVLLRRQGCPKYVFLLLVTVWVWAR